MKIRSLSFANLNSLKGEHEIHFATGPLAEAGIFAITGATGAGKSTILDAITLALFGRAARYGSEQNPENMMSRGTAHCFAEVCFETSRGIYRARWDRRRSRNKPEGKMQGAKRQLAKIDGEIIAEKIKEVDDLVTEISGMSYAQFTRSVLLAQGKFKEFLEAKPKERGELLERITGTEIYSKIGARCYAKAKELNTAIKEASLRLEGVELIDKATLDSYLTQQREIKKAISAPEKELAQLEQGLLLYRQLREAEGALYTIETALHNQRSKSEEFKPNLTILERYQRALPFEGELHSLQELQKQRKELEQQQRQLTTQQQNCRTAAIEQLRTTLNALAHEATATKTTRSEIEKQSSELTEQREAILQQLTAHDQPLTERDQLPAVKERLEAQRTELLNQHEQIKNGSELQQRHRAKNSELQTVATAIEKSAAELKKIEENAAQQRPLLQREREILKDKETIELQRQQIASLSERRAQLRDDEPCPLCGATEHPYAAALPEMEDSEVALQKQRVEKMQAELHKLENEIAAHQSSATAQQSQQQNLQRELTEIAQRFATLETLKAIDNKITIAADAELLTTARDAIIERGTAVAELIKRSDELALLYTREHTNTVKLEQLSEKIKQLQSDRQSYLDKLSSFDAQHEDAPIQPSHKLHELRSHCDSAIDAHTAAASQCRAAEQQLQQLGTKEEQRCNALFESCKEVGINSIAELGEILAQKQTTQALLNQQQELEKELITLQARQSEAAASLEKLRQQKPPAEEELTSHQQRIAAIKEQLNSDRERLGELNQLIEAANNAQAKHSSEIDAITRMQREAKPWLVLNDMIGSAEGTLFSTCAQALTLAQLIILANNYLRDLDGRYSITTIAQSQLELEIIDHFQADVHRPAKSLSGGESFLVSLALALGLSELSGSKARIETLFIDEGFGTLDSETLDVALSALEALRLSNRTVGVISHIESLKSRLATQVQVHKQSDGSAKLQVVEFA